MQSEREGSVLVTAAPPVFERPLVGVDGSVESVEAARQAALLAEGELELLSVYDALGGLVGGTGLGVPAYYDDTALKQSAEAALQEAAKVVGDMPTTARVAQGAARDVLRAEAVKRNATLIALGSHGTARLAGILVGSTATELLHSAPCSVLVARPAGTRFPQRIVVGVDGSAESAAAYATARSLAERFGARVWPVVAYKDGEVDRAAVDELLGHRREELHDDPVHALLAAGREADLLIVGSRGLKGFKALGSVSERVAHKAQCSVLVVRPPRIDTSALG